MGDTKRYYIHDGEVRTVDLPDLPSGEFIHVFLKDGVKRINARRDVFRTRESAERRLFLDTLKKELWSGAADFGHVDGDRAAVTVYKERNAMDHNYLNYAVGYRDRILDSRPPSRVSSGDTSFVVQVDLPDSVVDSVTFYDSELVVRAHRDRLNGAILDDLRYGTFVAKQTFSADTVDVDGITAEYRRGVLTVVLPKTAKEKPRTIPVKTAD